MFREIRYGWRHLSRARGFSLLAIVTLALAGGGTGALVSLLNAVVLRPLNVPEPERLAVVSITNDTGVQGFISLPAIEDLRRPQDVFAGLCGTISGASVRIEIDGVMSDVTRDSVTGDCLQMLGVRPHLGRLIGEREYAAAEPVAVIGQRFWQQELRGDPAIIGKTLRIEATPVTIIGVASSASASSININQTPDVILPLSLMGRLYKTPAALRGYELIGRLRPGVTLAAAQARLAVLWPDVYKAAIDGPDPLARQYMRGYRHIRVESGEHGISSLRTRYARPLSLLLWLALIVLVVACFNVGGLLLTRMFARQHELGVHLALGSTWAQVARQLLIEGVMLSLAATVLAVPLAFWFAQGLGAMLWTAPWPMGLRLTPDTPVLAAMLAGGVLCGVVVSLPSVTFWRVRPAQIGGGSSRTVTGGINWTGRTLIAGQLALTLTLMFSAGLFMQHLAQLRTIDPGYPTDGWFSLRPVRVPGQVPRIDMAVYQRGVLERLAAIEGVSAVAMSTQFPLATRTQMPLIPVRDLDAGTEADESSALREMVSPDFFRLLGIKLMRGRTFTWDDDANHLQVAMINVSLARQLFGAAGEAAAVGRRIRITADPKTPVVEIVGVVADASPGDVRITRLPMVYRPILQEPLYLQNPIFVLRARGTEGFAAAVRQVMTASGLYYVVSIRSAEEQIARTMLTERTLLVLSSFVGGLSVVLAALGLYSLLAYSVSRRMRELALRMALGASHTTVMSMVIREGLTLAVLGIVLGVPIALASGRVSRRFLEELPASSVGPVAAAAALLLAIGLIAVAAPARRAARTDPALALRE